MQATIEAAVSIEPPVWLKRLADPPAELWQVGTVPDSQPVAIVGTRRPTVYGKRVATELAARLGAAGVPIVSGLAFGIDVTVHRAALEAGGQTIAVLPAGLGRDDITPQTHLRLAETIAERGALLSEYPPGTAVRVEQYLARNRLIAGLSRCVVVVEAALPSGSLTTAQHAIDNGINLWAVPGPITSDVSAGTNKLLFDGAQALANIDDFIEAVAPEAQTKPSVDPLLDQFSKKPRHRDEVTGVPADELPMVMTKLELRGVIRHLGGGYYIRS